MSFRQVALPDFSSASYLDRPAMAASDRSVFLFGGILASGAPADDAVLELELGTGIWQRRAPSCLAASPRATSGHTLVALRSDLLLLGARGSYSGGGDRKRRPTHALQLETSEQIAAELWTLAMDGSSPLAWRRASTPPELARSGHCAVPFDPMAMMLVHGGEGAEGLLDDVWQWDAVAARAQRPDGHPASATGGWQLLNGGVSSGGLRPAARQGHACAVLPGGARQLLVSGGFGHGGVALHDGVWSFDLLERTWRLLTPRSDPSPLPRSTQFLPPPALATCAERALSLACEEDYVEGGGAEVAGGGSRGAIEARSRLGLGQIPSQGAIEAARAEMRSAPMAPHVWQYSASRGGWERLRLRATSGSGARLAASPCPQRLRYAQAASPPTCDASTRLWLLGEAVASEPGRLPGMLTEGAAEAADAPRPSAPPPRWELWQLGAAGIDCGGCVHGECLASSSICACEAGWAGPHCTIAICGVGCGAHGTCDPRTRRCRCDAPWYGAQCERRVCLDECRAPHGRCDELSGACMCSEGRYGRACQSQRCPACAMDAQCNAATGCCNCPPGYEGCDCSQPSVGIWHRQVMVPSVAKATAAAASNATVLGGTAASYLPAWRHGAACGVCDEHPILFGGLTAAATAIGPPTLAADVWQARGPARGPRQTSEAQWVALTASEDVEFGAPTARRAAGSVGLGGVLLLLHGGLERGARPLDDSWVLRCTPLAPGAPSASWQLLRPRGDSRPAARAYHTLTTLPTTARAQGVRVLLFGGSAPVPSADAVPSVFGGSAPVPSADAAADGAVSEPTGTFFGDVWMLSIGETETDEAETERTDAHRLDADVHSGHSQLDANVPSRAPVETWSQLWTPRDGMDTQEDDEDHQPRARAPSPRAAHAAVTHAYGPCCDLRGCLVISGGVDTRHRPLGDLWQFCVETRVWSELHAGGDGPGGGGSTAPWPAPRHQHSLTALVPPAGAAATNAHFAPTTAPALLLYGGISVPRHATASPLLDDGLWLYGLRERAWVRVHTPAGGARPAARLGHVAVAPTPSTLWLWGGVTDDPDAWFFHMPAAFGLALATCFGEAVGADGEAPGVRPGCSAQGSCDLASGRCICDPPWTGDDCSEQPLTPVAARQPIARRTLVVLFCFFGALVAGAALGWLQRGRRLLGEEAQREKDRAREAMREAAKRKHRYATQATDVGPVV